MEEQLAEASAVLGGACRSSRGGDPESLLIGCVQPWTLIIMRGLIITFLVTQTLDLSGRGLLVISQLQPVAHFNS